MKTFKQKWEKLLELEKDYLDITWQGEYIYPYIRTKIYGILHRDYNYLDNNTKPLGTFSSDMFVSGKQLSSFFLGKQVTQNCDVLFVPFYRFDFDGEDYVDSRSDKVYKDLKKQGLDVLRLIYKSQSPYLPSDDQTYYMEDINTVVEKRLVELNEASSGELERLYQFQKEVQEKLDLRFLIDEFLKEFGNRAIGYREYLRKALKVIKPKVIIIAASYLFSDLVLVAREQGIPVIDIQYAAFTFSHVGYNFKYPSMTFPDLFLGWEEFWNRKDIFGNQNYSFIPIGKESDFSESEQKDNRKVIFVSQNLITGFIFQEAIKFAKAYPDYEVLIKLHPNDNYTENLESKVESLDNLSVLAQDKEKISDAQYIAGVGSSLLFEMIAPDRKIIILDNYMNAFMTGLNEEENVFFVENLVDEFSTIVEKNFSNIDNIVEVPQEIDYANIIEQLTSDTAPCPLEKEDNPIFDVFNIKNKLSNQGITLVDNLVGAVRNLKDSEYLISIVVGVFNDENNVDLLFKCLNDLEIVKSAVAEVIFIDAGSSDETVARISERIGEMPNFSIQEGDSEAPTSSMQTRKKGYQTSKGKYLYFLDGDDFVPPFNLDIAAILLDRYELDILKASVNVHFASDDSLTTWKLPYQLSDKNFDYISSSKLTLPLRFMHNHIYRKASINPEIFDLVDIEVGEDHYFNDLQYLDVKKVMTVPFSLNVYIKQTDGTESTKEYTEQKYYNALVTFLEVLKEFKLRRTVPHHSLTSYIDKAYIKGMLKVTPKLKNAQSDLLFSDRVVEVIENINNFLLKDFSLDMDLPDLDQVIEDSKSERLAPEVGQFVCYNNKLFYKGSIEIFDIVNSEYIPEEENDHVVFNIKDLPIGITTIKTWTSYPSTFKKTFEGVSIEISGDEWTIGKKELIQLKLTYGEEGVWTTNLTPQGVVNETRFVRYGESRYNTSTKLTDYHSVNLSTIGSIKNNNWIINYKKPKDFNCEISDTNNSYLLKLSFSGQLIINDILYKNSAVLKFNKEFGQERYALRVEGLGSQLGRECVINHSRADILVKDNQIMILSRFQKRISLEQLESKVEKMDLNLDLDLDFD